MQYDLILFNVLIMLCQIYKNSKLNFGFQNILNNSNANLSLGGVKINYPRRYKRQKQKFWFGFAFTCLGTSKVYLYSPQISDQGYAYLSFHIIKSPTFNSSLIFFKQNQKSKMSLQQRYRPLITSLAFNNQNAYLPLRYNYTLQQIDSIKKYLPKHLFKLGGIDIEAQSVVLTKQQEQMLQKAKLKVKAINGVWTQNKRQIQIIPKQQVKIIQWYNKFIDLRIPYNSKDSQVKIQASIFEHVNYYIENFMFFKNMLTQQLLCTNVNTIVKLTTQQIATQTDVVLLNWSIQPQPSDNQLKVISLNLPVVLCLQLKELKALIKVDLTNCLTILMKNSFNTRVMYVGQGEKQFLCLNSYCLQENAIKEQTKLKAIIKQNKILLQQTQQSKNAAKKDHKFLILILASLMLVYFILKIFPIHGKDQNQYLNNQPKTQPVIFGSSQDERIF